MRIYFARHGQSQLNEDNLIHQSPGTPLSEMGIKQAQKFAEKVKALEVKRLFSSPYSRARSVAEEVSKIAGLAIEELDLLKERKRPSEVEGKKYDDPEAVKIKRIVKKNYTDPDFRYSDEETFKDLKDRAGSILRFFEEIEESPALAITHEHILILMVTLLLIGEGLTVKQYLQVDNLLEIENTALIACDYEEGQWKVVLPELFID